MPCLHGRRNNLACQEAGNDLGFLDSKVLKKGNLYQVSKDTWVPTCEVLKTNRFSWVLGSSSEILLVDQGGTFR